jgi:EpsI family protein
MAAGCAAIFIFYPALVALFLRWQEPVSYFDHAIFVPFVCAWMASRTRESLRTSVPAAPRPYLAFFLMLFALGFQFFGVIQQITFLQGAALVLAIWAAVLWFGGIGIFKAYRWPLFYLCLLIPVPTFFMAELTLGMRELSTVLATASLQVITAILGLPFERVGNQLSFGGHQVTIVDACSGMNTLLTVIAVGAVLIYLERSRLNAWLMTLSLIPTAILANLFRILVLCLFVGLNQGTFAFSITGHAIIGVTTVGLAIAVLAFGIRAPGKWEKKFFAKRTQTTSANAPDLKPTQRTNENLAPRLAVFTALLVCTALVSAKFQSSSKIPASGKKESLPQLNLPSWQSKKIPMDEQTYDVVGTHDAYMFQFDPLAVSPKPFPVYLYWVHSENSRKIGHPPELCYRGDSYEILQKTQEQIRVENRSIPINRLVVERGNYRLLVYYWYRIGGVETASYLEQQLRWAWNQIKHSQGIQEATQEGTMIRVSTEIENQQPESAALAAAKSRLENWISEEDRLNRQ